MDWEVFAPAHSLYQVSFREGRGNERVRGEGKSYLLVPTEKPGHGQTCGATTSLFFHPIPTRDKETPEELWDP
ncbi:hypothetical protein NPIL_465201 [Nephila pilipes]|uniref:Uncharacterized protein n=1 Tax=Nephila pilipes TaxID=299642 RepID=A0A8X6N316_NEPPI|nr:hypothetical protein NPIL_465201 [Nephila pilipes]